MHLLNSFKLLVQAAVGNASVESLSLNENEWQLLYDEANKQALTGVLFGVLEKMPKQKSMPVEVIMKWYSQAETIKKRNELHNKAVKELTETFREAGFWTSVLKGQGLAKLYPEPSLRICGDIDLWVDGDREDIVSFCKERWDIHHVDIKNMVITNYPNVHLEVHFIPSWFYNPITNEDFSIWYKRVWHEQFDRINESGFCTPTIGFNLVYCLVHIYKHLFDEGIGLRQLMDYYFVLIHSTQEERKQAYKYLRRFRMKGFAGAVMYVMQDVFAMSSEYLLCPPNEYLGKKMLNDVLSGGSFGKYDQRNAHGKENRIQHGLRNLRHNMSLVLYYPSEVLWSPIWKCWHWCWRKWHGYL